MPRVASIATGSSGPGVSPLLRGLRLPANEVQLVRLLAAVCEVSPQACHDLLEVVLSAAADQPSEAGANASETLRSMPADVHCEQQRQLPFGIVDLSFRGAGGWQLICEVKIDAPFERTQRERYLNAGLPLVCLVRSAGSGAATFAQHANWLGEVAWMAILPGLERLSLPEPDAALWRDILKAIAEDGDFDRKRQRPKLSAADEALAVQVQRTLNMALARVLIAQHGEDADSFLDRLQGPVRRHDADWAGVELRTKDDDHLVLSVWLRRAATQTPEIELWWDAAGRSVARSLAESLRREHFEPFPRGDHSAPQWLNKRTLTAAEVVANGAAPAVMSAVTTALMRLAAVGAFDDYMMLASGG